jgi:hypothetical protein
VKPPNPSSHANATSPTDTAREFGRAAQCPLMFSTSKPITIMCPDIFHDYPGCVAARAYMRRHERLSTFLLLLLAFQLTEARTARALQPHVSNLAPPSNLNASAPVQNTPAPTAQESSNSTLPTQQAAQQAGNSLPSTTQTVNIPSPSPAVGSNSRDRNATGEHMFFSCCQIGCAGSTQL